MEGENRKDLAKPGSRQLTEKDEYILSTEIHRGYEPYEEEINIRDYIDVLLRRKWIIISCLVISVVTVTIASLVMDPIYKAEATIEISPDNPKITTFEEVVEVESRQKGFYETQYKLIQSKTLVKEVIDVLNLGSHPEFSEVENGFIPYLEDKFSKITSAVFGFFSKKKKKPDPNIQKQAQEKWLVGAFLSRLEVQPDEESRLAKVSFDSRYPELSAKVASTVVDEYIEWIIERKVGTTKVAREFLDKQLFQVQVRLEKAEEKLSEFAKGVDIFSLEDEDKLSPTHQQLIDLTGKLSEAEAERVAKEALYREVKEGNYEFLPQVINDSSIQTLSQNYTNLKAKYDNLAVIYGSNYPDLKQLAAQMRRVENDIGGRVKGIAESIKRDYQAALARENILKKRIEQQKKLVSNLNEKAIQYRILEREVNTNKSVYENLLQRLKETEITSAIKATNIQVVDYASVPLAPYKPNVPFYIFIATIVGVMGGIFMAFVFEHFDNTIKDEEDVKNQIPVPFLGAVPALTKEDNVERVEKVVYEDSKSIVAEAFRVIRTSILYSSPEQPPKSILMTSTQPIEGKTTSASNLALSMVQSGLKVVLVDADLRKPRLHKIFTDNGNGFGLSTFLVGKMGLEGILNTTDVEGLDFISSGPIPPNPAELLASNRMKQLLERLGENYDHVILDAPPVTGFADSRLLSIHVDGVLLVTSIGITQRQFLRTSVDEIMKIGGRIIGTIVNRVEPGRGKYGYGYYYYYRDEDVGYKKNKGLHIPNSS